MTDTADRYAGLPDWSDSTKETYCQIEDDNPRLTAAQRAALFEACSLLALADDLAATIPDVGLMTTGSQGQHIVNPAVAEIRALRRDAMAALRALDLSGVRDATAASKAGASLVGARWNR
ncbi:hypothetical protein [Microbacterium sp. R86528]|uniref:hypothetical protein n=1 Tax=Microbacterium sp. R86528 TaxID=3093864 RepID=UPI0037C5CE03